MTNITFKMNIKDIERESTTQQFFDSFNEFIMSSDKKVFNKLVARSVTFPKLIG